MVGDGLYYIRPRWWKIAVDDRTADLVRGGMAPYDAMTQAEHEMEDHYGRTVVRGADDSAETPPDNPREGDR
jgi:hypothetical protein